MRLFDSHCHFETHDAVVIAGILRRAKTAGVVRIMAVGGSPALNEAAILCADVARQLGEEAPLCAMACGLDRDHADSVPQSIPDAPLAAWGEIGLDYHYSPETRASQCAHFASQLEEARRRDLPVIVHTREADDDTLALLREIPSHGVIHCFTGNPTFCRQLLDLGFFISISGIVTFRAADNVRESALAIPDDRLLIETDSPFLAPVPLRGKTNEPAFLEHTARFLAELRGTAPETLAEQTCRNAERLFRLS